MKSIKKILSIALCCAMTIPLVACSGSQKNGNAGSAVSNATSTDGIYRKVVELKCDGEMGYSNAEIGKDGNIYAYYVDLFFDDVMEPSEESAVVEEVAEAVETAIEGESTEETAGDTESESVDAAEENTETTDEGDSDADNTGETADATETEEVNLPNEEVEDIESAETKEAKYVIDCFSVDGTLQHTTDVSLPVDLSIQSVSADKDGKLYAAYCGYNVEDGTSESYIGIINADGTIAKEGKIQGEDEYASVDHFVITDDGKVLVTIGKRLLMLDEELNVVATNDSPANFFENIYYGKGKLYAVYSNEDYNYVITEVDPATGKLLGEGTLLPQNIYNIIGGPEYDIYYQAQTAIMGVNIDNLTNPKKTFDVIASNVYGDSYGVSGTQIDATHYMIKDVDENYNTTVSVYEAVDPSEITEKKVITIGGISISTEIVSKVKEFNDTHTDCRMVLVDYSQYNTDSWKQGETVLKNDILAGKCPDICLITVYTSAETYMKKGVFADLNEVMKDDPDYSIDSFVPNIVDICSRDGKLYYIPTEFTINTYGMKESLYKQFGEEKLTPDNISKLDDMVSSGRAFDDTTCDNLFNSAMMYSYSDYVDLKTGKCNFDSPEFIALMNYAKKYPAEYSDDAFSLSSEANIKNNVSAIKYQHISNFRDFNQSEHRVYGENAVLVGYPTRSGNGSIAMLSNKMAISKKSENKEAAWEFIKMFLCDEYQDNLQWGFPVKQSSFDKMAEASQKKEIIHDEITGEDVEYDEEYYDDATGNMVVIDPISADRAEYLKNYIYSVKSEYVYDTDILAIVQEESAPFFAGDKTAEECASIIQSRVQLFVSENN